MANPHDDIPQRTGPGAGLARAFARARVPLSTAGVTAVAVTMLWILLHLSTDAVPDVPGWLIQTGIALIALGFVATVWAPVSGGPALELAAPVSGRWMAINSPTDRLPSHGTHGFGQTYAVDLLIVPEGGAPSGGDLSRGDRSAADGLTRLDGEEAGAGAAPRRWSRGPEEYPSFGLPIHAPADAEVVIALSAVRDHRSRVGRAGIVLFVLESMLRELRGTRGMLGNHVVLRLADGTHFVLAHLKQDSVTVRPGDRVHAGQAIAQCGNTGNSTEPHLHCQRQDIARTAYAAGLPWTIVPGGIPATGSYLDEGMGDGPDAARSA
ncbi:MAG: M23 family metallopeptidase [Mycetocola sp.]